MRKPTLAVAACLLTANIPAAAPGAAGLGEIIPLMCPALFRQLAGNPDMFAALEKKSLDPVPACGCAQARFMEDPQIDKLAALDPEDLDTRAGPAGVVRSYVALRAIEAVIRCMADDLDGQLAQVRIVVDEGEPAAAPRAQD